MSNQTVADQLSKVIQDHPEVVKQTPKVSRTVECAEMLDITQDENGITVIAKDPAQVGKAIKSVMFLFQCILHVVKERNKEAAWTVRYAAEIVDQNLPFLLDHVSFRAALDPMAPYRNATKSLASGDSIFLVFVKAKVFYAKKRELIHSLNEKPQYEQRKPEPRKEGTTSSKHKGKHRGDPKKSHGTPGSYRPPELDSEEDSSIGRDTSSVQPTDD